MSIETTTSSRALVPYEPRKGVLSKLFSIHPIFPVGFAGASIYTGLFLTHAFFATQVLPVDVKGPPQAPIASPTPIPTAPNPPTAPAPSPTPPAIAAPKSVPSPLDRLPVQVAPPIQRAVPVSPPRWVPAQVVPRIPFVPHGGPWGQFRAIPRGFPGLMRGGFPLRGFFALGAGHGRRFALPFFR